MSPLEQFPEDFRECVRFHGHVCPGLAIGYAAAKAGASALNVGPSEDEEVVAIVENDSCAVDAVQTILGCTFGKGNLIFRDWGKQVFTFFNRVTGDAVRVSFRGGKSYGRKERAALREKIDSGQATDQEQARYDELKFEAVSGLIDADPEEVFDIRRVDTPLPPSASIVATLPCQGCGEQTMESRLTQRDDRKLCGECAQRESSSDA